MLPLEKWKKWLGSIDKDLSRTIYDNTLFLEVATKIVDRNDKLNWDNYFLGYLRRSHASHILMGIRRQLKNDKKSISLKRLVCEVRDLANNKYFDAEQDLSDLETKHKRIENVGDRLIAHADKRGSPGDETYGEVEDCLDYLKNLWLKYARLLEFNEGKIPTTLKIPFQPDRGGDYSDIFCFPWIDTTNGGHV